MNVPPITLALSKGRIFEETLPLLAAAGVRVREEPEHSRRLILPTTREGLRVVLVRATDVPTYVACGGADLGVAGLDTIIEHGGAGCYRPLDLRIARCHMAVAVPEGFDWQAAARAGRRISVATKFVRITREFFARRGMYINLIKLYGSMELAPLTGLADAIVDVVSSGQTLRANRLVEVAHVMDISAHLLVNQASLKLKSAELRPLIDAIASAIRSGSDAENPGV